MRNIISNTSCLIIFDNLEMLDILKELYGNIIILSLSVVEGKKQKNLKNTGKIEYKT